MTYCPLDLDRKFYCAGFSPILQSMRVLPSVLWIAHTHLIDCLTQLLGWHSCQPEKRSGKTRALEVTALLVPETRSVNQCFACRHRAVSQRGQANNSL